MLRLKEIKHEINGKELYKGLNLLFGNGEKVGIIGRNGCGKSTLFRIILREEPPTEGNLLFEGEVVGYLPQEIFLPKDKMLGEYIEELVPEIWDQYRVHTILNRLKYGEIDEYQDMSTLSEGQKMKIKLCEILLAEPSILLLDEPTNHLDLNGIVEFEGFVKSYEGIVLMISHDRAFLNNTVDKIVEIDQGDARVFEGNYDAFKKGKEEWIERNALEYSLFLKKKARLERLIENVHKIKDGKKRGRAVQAAKKRFDREITANEKSKYSDKGISSLSLEGVVHTGQLVVRGTDLTKAYGKNLIFENLNFEIRGKERVWLYGPNGAGKSTLVKILMNKIQPTFGDVRWGQSIRTGYFAQVWDHSLDENILQDYYMEQTGATYEDSFGGLGKFLFTKADLRKRLGNLSPGERARLLLCIFVKNEYELLILDEPTNHLDIPTKELIEKALSDYKGALLLISHDRYFVEQVGVDRVMKLA